MTNGEQWLPPNRIWSDTKLKSSTVINATNEDYIILHYWGETRAFQCSTPNSLEELVVEVDRIGTTVNSLLQELDEIDGCPMEQMPIGNSDMINHIPRILGCVSQARKETRL